MTVWLYLVIVFNDGDAVTDIAPTTLHMGDLTKQESFVPRGGSSTPIGQPLLFERVRQDIVRCGLIEEQRSRQIASIRIAAPGTERYHGPASGVLASRPAVRAPSCRTVLKAISRLLPPGTRDDELAEWTDELACAARDKRSVVKRTASIVLRAMPKLLWRAMLAPRRHRE